MDSTLSTILGPVALIDLFTISASLILLFAARPICNWLSGDESLTTRISIMRVLNFLIIVAVILKIFIFNENNWAPMIAQCLIVIYFAVLGTQIINFFIRHRFGKKRQSKDRVSISDTYTSRGLSLLVAVVVTIIALVACLNILGLKSLLEAGGALGIIGLFLAMTQASWAPDIISGLIILNSRLCEEGDVIQFNMDGKLITASIFRTKLFHTECLDLANNHRLMVRNAKLRDHGLQNLSRFASARGLRECLQFNIDYKHPESEVSAMFMRAFEKIDEAGSLREEQFDPEIMVLDTGDYAVTWGVYYYIKEVKQVLGIKQQFRAQILAEANRSNISLATPVLQNAEIAMRQSPPDQNQAAK